METKDPSRTYFEVTGEMTNVRQRNGAHYLTPDNFAKYQEPHHEEGRFSFTSEGNLYTYIMIKDEFVRKDILYWLIEKN
jgi:hypothetical protein